MSLRILALAILLLGTGFAGPAWAGEPAADRGPLHRCYHRCFCGEEPHRFDARMGRAA